MSEPVSKTDVEDVLSSIRRLISDDVHPVRRVTVTVAGGNPPNDAARADKDRLVLTPALRVADEQDAPFADVDDDWGATESAEVIVGDIPTFESKRSIAKEENFDGTDDVLQNDVVGAPGVFAPGGASDESEAEEVEIAKDGDAPIDQADAGKTDADTQEPSDSADLGDDRFGFLSHLRSEFRHTVPDGEDKNRSEDQPDEPAQQENMADPLILGDAQTVDCVSGAEHSDAEHADEENRDEEHSNPECDEDEGDQDGQHTELFQDDRRAAFQRADPLEISMKMAQLEVVVGQTADQWEPDGTGKDDYSGTAVDAVSWEEQGDLDGSGNPIADKVSKMSESVKNGAVTTAPTDVVAKAAPQAAEPEIWDDVDTTDADAETFADDAVLDEDALRELVCDIIREELQGALGERITRNVRKLVRREIHRALAAQDIE